MSGQDAIAFGIVGIAAGITLRHGYRKYVRAPLASYFLKHGKVGLAMRVRGAKAKGAKDCGNDCGCD